MMAEADFRAVSARRMRNVGCRSARRLCCVGMSDVGCWDGEEEGLDVDWEEEEDGAGEEEDGSPLSGRPLPGGVRGAEAV